MRCEGAWGWGGPGGGERELRSNRFRLFPREGVCK